MQLDPKFHCDTFTAAVKFLYWPTGSWVRAITSWFCQWREKSTLCPCHLSWLSFRNSTASLIWSLQHKGSWTPPRPVPRGSSQQIQVSRGTSHARLWMLSPRVRGDGAASPGASVGLQLRAQPIPGIWNHQLRVFAPQSLPALHHGDLSTRVHLGQPEILENTTCLFILIFQDFHSSHDEVKRDSRVGWGAPAPSPPAENVMSPCPLNCKSKICLYISDFNMHNKDVEQYTSTYLSLDI